MEAILNTLIEQYKEDILKEIQNLIKVPSVIHMESAEEGAPFGREIRTALDKVMDLSQNLGFEVRDYDGYAASVRFGDAGKEIGILSHIDVVPPGNGWSRPPFEPWVEDGKLYGRGAVDDKGPMVAALYAMKAVKESGLPIRNHVCHIIGCDEETGHRCIKYYLTREKQPDLGFSPDGSFSVIHAEKGILRFKIQEEWKETEGNMLHVERIEAGTVVNAVPNSAKVWLKGTEEILDSVREKFLSCREKENPVYEEGRLVLSFRGVSAHAMQPWLGDNAILPMVDFLCQLPLTEEERRYFEALQALFADGWEGKNMGIACEDQLSGKLSMNLGILNLKDGQCEAKIDVRCPVHIDLDMVWKTIELNCRKYGFEAEYWQKRPSLYVPKEAELVQTLLTIYNEMTGQREEPIVIGGGTYCRDVENFVSFGPVFPGEPELAHEANEYIDIESHMKTAKIYAQALYQLVK